MPCDSIRRTPGHRSDREERVVAKHRKPKNRRASSRERTVPKQLRSPSLFLVGTTATAISTVLVFGHATNNTVATPQVELAAATIGIGGRGDPNADRIPNKLSGILVRPSFGYLPVHYPAGFDIDNSVAAGVPELDKTIKDNQTIDNKPQFLLVAAYSEGTIVAEEEKRNLANDPTRPAKADLLFVMVASPNVPNGGIFGRFPLLKIPYFVTSNGPAQPSEYDSIYHTSEYDPYGDFPAYFNPLSLANTLVAVVYVHPEQYYDNVNPTPEAPLLVKPVENSEHGSDTYLFYKAAHLPLLAPGRQVFGIIGLTPLTEPVLGAIEPLLRLAVDMGYTDRENLNPEDHVQFSFITPPGRILETIAGVPGALGQGVNNFATGVGSLTTSIPTPFATTNSPSINAESAPQESLVNDDPPAAVADPAPAQAPSGSGTEEPVSPLSGPGPTLGAVTEDGHKVTPNTPNTTTSPKKNVFTQLADTFNGFFSPKKKPAPSTPTSDPNDSTPSGPTPQGQSEGPTSNAA